MDVVSKLADRLRLVVLSEKQDHRVVIEQPTRPSRSSGLAAGAAAGVSTRTCPGWSVTAVIR
jgi:hypothetical protein